MHALFLSLALFNQAEVPPSPAAVIPVAAAESLDDMRAWLMARLIVDLSFNAQKSAEVKALINDMNETQMRALVALYKERTAKREQTTKIQQETGQQQALEQGKLNQQQLEAYRDHLKREYDYQILASHMTQNLLYQNIVNNQRAMYGPFGYTSICYAPFGYGVNYGGFGYGSAMFGGPVGYGGAYYGGAGFY